LARRIITVRHNLGSQFALHHVHAGRLRIVACNQAQPEVSFGIIALYALAFKIEQAQTSLPRFVVNAAIDNLLNVGYVATLSNC
jgi:hypothetical protein